MPFTTPLLGDAAAANNTGEYHGYQVRVKGDNRVELQKDGQTWIYRNYIDAIHWIDLAEGGGTPPVADVAPILDSLDPATAELDSADVTMTVHGTGFTESSVIMFADQPEPIVFVSETEISTVVKPSLSWGAVTVPVSVKNGEEESNLLDFTFTEAEPAATRSKAKARK